MPFKFKELDIELGSAFDGRAGFLLTEIGPVRAVSRPKKQSEGVHNGSALSVEMALIRFLG